MDDFSPEREAWLDHQENMERLANEKQPTRRAYFEAAVWVILLAIMSLMCWMGWGIYK